MNLFEQDNERKRQAMMRSLEIVRQKELRKEQGLPTDEEQPKKKTKKNAVNPHVYVSGLPSDVSEQELQLKFGKIGELKRIKVYRLADGTPKGDALITYEWKNAVAAVFGAERMLNGQQLRPNDPMSVMSVGEARWEKDAGGAGQAQEMTGERRVVELRNMFREADAAGDPHFYKELEGDVFGECEKCGGLLSCKSLRLVEGALVEGTIRAVFATCAGADACYAMMNGRFFDGMTIAARLTEALTSDPLGALNASHDEFLPAADFEGRRPGYAFKVGDTGLGYYLDPHQGPPPAPARAPLPPQNAQWQTEQAETAAQTHPRTRIAAPSSATQVQAQPQAAVARAAVVQAVARPAQAAAAPKQAAVSKPKLDEDALLGDFLSGIPDIE